MPVRENISPGLHATGQDIQVPGAAAKWWALWSQVATLIKKEYCAKECSFSSIFQPTAWIIFTFDKKILEGVVSQGNPSF